MLILKALQGLGFGAAWVAAAVLVTESLPVESRGRALGVVQSGWALGWGAAAIAFGIFFTWYKPEDAWRLAFVVSLVPMVILLYCSASVVEPARSVENVRPGSFFADAAQVFHRDHLRVTLLGGLFGFGAHAGFYGLFTWLPFVLESERGLPVSWISTNLAVLIVAFGAGCLVTGYFSDRYGRRFTVAAFALSSAGCSAVYFFTPTGPLAGLLIGIPIGFFSAGVPASAGALFSELYPKEIRGSGLGFCYNFGRLGAAAVPYLIGALSESYPVELVVGCFAAVA